jgi:hypothetical protein
MSDTAINVKYGRPINVKVYDIPQVSKLTELSPSGDGLEIADIDSFSYYESIYDSFVFARLRIFDSSGVLQKAFGGCGIRNLCAVEIEFNDPSTGTDYQRGRNSLKFTGPNCFYVSRIANQLIQGKKQVYDIELMNRDALCSTRTHLKQTWPPTASTGVEYNLPINDVLKNVIKSAKDTSEVTSEPSFPVDKIVGNGMQPYKFIAECCRSAVSKEYSKSGASANDKEEKKAAGYLFYETHDKYNFHSIAKLITSADVISENHIFKVSIVNDSATTESEASQRILQYKFNDGDNTTDVIQEIISKKRGKAQHYLFDVTRNVYKKIDSSAKPIEDKCEKTLFDDDFKITAYLHHPEYLIEYTDICSPEQLANKPTHPALTSLNYSAILEALKSKTSSIRVPGNFSISAGDRIFVEVPTIQGDGLNAVETDNKYTGIYLVVKVSHRLEGVKDIYTDLEITQLKTST